MRKLPVLRNPTIQTQMRGVMSDFDMHPYWKHVQYRRKLPEEIKNVMQKYEEIWDSKMSENTKAILRQPAFNTWLWEDSDLIWMLQFMYEDTCLLPRLSVSISVLRSFLCTVYLNYNEVPFHNFRHAFSVAQMMYGIICNCGLKDRLDSLDILILLTSSICHDLDHPGFNNIYQINAKTVLALRYNDISPLENHHCAIAFSILEKEESNLLRNLTIDEYKRVREGVIRCILATDMARHNEILQDFKEVSQCFDWDDRTNINLLYMILIKVADISNEARPLDVAEPWLDCLMEEFFNQSDLEKIEGLPVSPFMDREKVTKPSSQCSFIGLVLLPLFESLGVLLSDLDLMMIKPVKDALDHYQTLNDLRRKSFDAKNEESQIQECVCLVEETVRLNVQDTRDVEIEEMSSNSTNSPGNIRRMLSKAESFTSIKSRTSSRTSGLLRATSSRETDPDVESTETEVDVSERTSRFKISTETHRSTSRRNSYERKSSIDSRFFDRTVSPRLLEERLRPHAETDQEEYIISSASSTFPSMCHPDLAIPTLGTSQLVILPSSSTLPAFPSKSSPYCSPFPKLLPDVDEFPDKKDRLVSQIIVENASPTLSQKSPVTSKGSPTSSIFSRLCFFSEKSSPPNKQDTITSENNVSTRPKNAIIKKQKVDPKSEHKSSRALMSKSKLTYKSEDGFCIKPAIKKPKSINENKTVKQQFSIDSVENKCASTFDSLSSQNERVNPDSVRLSPALSEKCSTSPNIFICHKKVSISLDVLPRKNGKAKSECLTPQNTPKTSESDLLSPESIEKTLSAGSSSSKKKKYSSARSLFFRSLSLRKPLQLKMSTPKPSDKDNRTFENI